MKTYTRPSRRTLRAHHLVKLGLILTLIVCVLISRRESPGNNLTKAQAGSPRTAAERMASFRGVALPDGGANVALELSGWQSLLHSAEHTDAIRPQDWHAQRRGGGRSR